MHSNQSINCGKEEVGTENLKTPKAFINHSQTVEDVY